MAFPLIPVAIFALIAAVAGGGKKRRRATPPAPGPDNGNGDGGEIYAFGINDFPPEGPESGPLEIDVLPGDMIRFHFSAPTGPSEWRLISEVAEGAPVLEVVEEVSLPGTDATPGTQPTYFADITVHPGRGTVVVDFLFTETGVDNPTVMKAKQAIINVV